MEEGSIQLNLPDGMEIELGILKEDKYGDLVKTNDYAWIIATQRDREVSMDSYNLGLKFNDENGKIIVEDEIEINEGIRSFSVI
ncbi:MAG: hypothetical protein DWQ19_11090 [Crenarchaeota archaeon]|nr:MAG: hypothetical protein DWQ19_11090 [Thermoproteota archaeon]